jgi:hypothetical protein
VTRRGRQTVLLGVVLTAVAGVAAVSVARLVVDRQDSGGAGPQATLADYWQGKARWALVRKWTSAQLGDDPYSGAHLELVGERWYLFNRAHRFGTCPDGEARVGVQVRESTDRGATWSDPVPILEPTPSTAWSCAVSDGDAVYDAARRTWRYLVQCKTDGGRWNGCYFERNDTSPMGRFDTPAGSTNPVLHSGELWSQICDSGDACAARTVGDEGTFNIFRRDSSGFWVSFHGSDGTRGYRGIAHTPDFSPGSFAVDQPDRGLPADAILGPWSAADFREQWAPGGPIGAGAGTIVSEADYLYTLNEFPDVSLRCTAGQTWDLGIFRSRSTASTTWEPFPEGNPIVRSSRALESAGQSLGCNVLYPTLFRDPGDDTWYLAHGRMSLDPAHKALYLYRLADDTSVLINDDFRAGDADGWSKHTGSTASLSVPPTPNGSPDGTSYLAFNCGAPACAGEASIYQDVRVDDSWRDEDFSFGGSFRSEKGTGSIDLVVHQLDAAGKVIRATKVPVVATGTYDTVQGAGAIADGARTLRFEMYVNTPPRRLVPTTSTCASATNFR